MLSDIEKHLKVLNTWVGEYTEGSDDVHREWVAGIVSEVYEAIHYKDPKLLSDLSCALNASRVKVGAATGGERATGTTASSFTW